MLETNGFPHMDIPLDLTNEIFNQEVSLLKKFEEVVHTASTINQGYQFYGAI